MLTVFFCDISIPCEDINTTHTHTHTSCLMMEGVSLKTSPKYIMIQDMINSENCIICVVSIVSRNFCGPEFMGVFLKILSDLWVFSDERSISTLNERGSSLTSEQGSESKF